MNNYILGLEINDSFLSAVVLKQRGKEKHIISFDAVALDSQQTLPEKLSQLMEMVTWQRGSCICGISMADLSIRNLTIPFVDKKKIKQVLAFELEDQLISPVTNQIVEYIHTGHSAESSNILVTAMEKPKLRRLVEEIDSCGLQPKVLGLRLVSLAEQTLINTKTSSDILFLDAGMQSLDMLFCQNGEVVFLRHLAYPEKMITEPPFHFILGKADISDEQDALSCIENICSDITRSLGFFNLETGLRFSPEKIVITGGLGHIEAFQKKVQDEFSCPVVLSNLRDEAGILIDSINQAKWNPVLHDSALSLALEGAQNKHTLNYLKEEFSPPQMFFAVRGRLLAASIALLLLFGTVFAYLGYDYHLQNNRYDRIGNQMQALFKETFPDRTKVQDPFVEMQAQVRNIQAPTVVIPVFTGKKRSLGVLADISERVPASINLQVSRLVIDQDSVQIKGITDTFNNVNIIQGNLRRSPLYAGVNIISAAADKDSKMIRFELRMETGAN